MESRECESCACSVHAHVRMHYKGTHTSQLLVATKTVVTLIQSRLLAMKSHIASSKIQVRVCCSRRNHPQCLHMPLCLKMSIDCVMAQTLHHCPPAHLPGALQQLACSALVNMTVDQPENKAKIGDLLCLNVWSAQISARRMTCRPSNIYKYLPHI